MEDISLDTYLKTLIRHKEDAENLSFPGATVHKLSDDYYLVAEDSNEGMTYRYGHVSDMNVLEHLCYTQGEYLKGYVGRVSKHLKIKGSQMP